MGLFLCVPFLAFFDMTVKYWQELKWARGKSDGIGKSAQARFEIGTLGAQLCCLHAGADYLPAICIRLKRTNISVITMFILLWEMH